MSASSRGIFSWPALSSREISQVSLSPPSVSLICRRIRYGSKLLVTSWPSIERK